MLTQGPCVLDATALLAMLRGEPAAGVFVAALSSAVMSAVTWWEVLEVAVHRGLPIDDLADEITDRGLRLEPFTAMDATRVIAFNAALGAGRLSPGPLACLALSERLQIPVVTADPVLSDVCRGSHWVLTLG